MAFALLFWSLLLKQRMDKLPPFGCPRQIGNFEGCHHIIFVQSLGECLTLNCITGILVPLRSVVLLYLFILR